MAQKYGIQYVNFYTDGSSARKITPVRQAPKVVLPAPKKRKMKRITVCVDPVAILGILVALAMLIMMLVGLSVLQKQQQQAEKMERYLAYLDQQNQELTEKYESSYDLEEVERTALALGMKPQSEVTTMMVRLPAESAPEETKPTVTFLTQLESILSDWLS